MSGSPGEPPLNPSLAPGEAFAGFIIERRVKTGGMGAIYLAKHPHLPRSEVLKILHPQFNADPMFVARFDREIHIVAQLNHPNILPIHDCGTVDGRAWFSMPFIDGMDAEEAARQGRMPNAGMPPKRAVDIIEKVAAALDYAHEHDVIHRDVKPANILITRRTNKDVPEGIYLSDFGIAKAVRSTSPLTAVGDRLLTFEYAAPEQMTDGPVDGRSDIYALGGVLYTLLTGEIPYPPDRVTSIAGHLGQPPPRPTKRNPALPTAFDIVIEKAMAKAPDDRFQTAGELAHAARDALASPPASSDPNTTTTVHEHFPAGSGSDKSSGQLPLPAVIPPSPRNANSNGAENPAPNNGGANRKGRWTAFAITVVLLVAVGIYWWSRTDSGTEPGAGQTASTPQTQASTSALTTSGVGTLATAARGSALAGLEQPAEGVTPLAQILDPAPERLPGMLNGTALASSPAYRIQPSNCPAAGQRITVDLGQGYQRITGNIQLDDSTPPEARIRFTVTGDGQELLDEVLAVGVGKSFDLPVTGISEQTITLESLGQGSCDSDDYLVFFTSALAYP